jgi:YHS domain-containing protein/putative intracellular protease/amidase
MAAVAREIRSATHEAGTAMNRRHLLHYSLATSLVTALPLRAAHSAKAAPAPAMAAALQPPATGPISVACVISSGAVVIDFCGPWEVFANVAVPGRGGAAFHLYTVADSLSPITAGGGMQIVPDFTFATAPAPKIIVIPAQHGAGSAALEWIRSASRHTDLTMSVCTGAFVLARTGLLHGLPATTHHNFYRQLAMEFPDIQVRRGARFVEAGKLASAGGLSSGIDLALRVVERYFGRETAASTADYMEYQGQGWLDPDSNAAYRLRRTSTAAHPLCPVCDMDVDVATAPKSMYAGKTYYFCMPSHKSVFDAAPEKYLEAAAGS